MTELIDLHCHIIPYVDDGAQDFSEALELLREMARQGVTHICATPHLRDKMFSTPDDEIKKRFEQLKEEAKREDLPVHLYLSREYHCDREFFPLLSKNALLPMGKGKGLLCEFSHSDDAAFVADTVTKVADAGYKPIVAHAERIEAVHKSEGLLDRLKKEGALIQVNADSVIGKEGFGQKLFCRKLAKEKKIDIIGSDAHDPVSRPPRLRECADWIRDKVGVTYARRVFYENPLSVLLGTME